MVVELTDSDLKEIFALFSSPTKGEVESIYSRDSHLFFEREELGAEYGLHQEKREFALDAWRAVMLFLHRNGYALSMDGESVDLQSSSGFSGG